MECPKCISPMVKVNFEDIAVDRCTYCQGLFLGASEKERLRQLRGAEVLDPGDATLGQAFNEVERINCPNCGSLMIRMVDLEQPHIWFEQCTVCSGSFFDAGEFRDLKHHTFVDFLRDLTVRERK